MIKGIFDSHAHYDDSRFDEDRFQVLDELEGKGVAAVINAASDLQSAEKSVELAEKFEFVYAAAGVHPHEAKTVDLKKIEAQLSALIKHEKVVAVGEIGLDYHYDFSPRDLQKKVFELQVVFAKNNDLPVIVHDREAHADTMDILKKYRPKGVVHCFSGSVEMMKEAVKLGLYIGLGGAVTFKNAKTPVEVAKETPLDRLLLETDAPYMAPVPFRSKRCDSSMIVYTAKKIADIRGIGVQELIDNAAQNTKNLLKI